MIIESSNYVDIQQYIDKGYIDADDEVAFKRIFEACNIFGHNYKGFQRGGTHHPYRNDVTIWFPKINLNRDWINSISTDENTIFERPANSSEVEEHMKFHIERDFTRIVFAYEKDKQNNLMYRFKGEYKIDKQQSYNEKCLVWKRISKRAKTYPPKV